MSRVRRGTIIHGPRQIENRYRARLRRLVLDLRREAAARLVPALVARLQEVQGIRADRLPPDFQRILDGLRVFGAARAQGIIDELDQFAEGVNSFNRRAFAQSMARLIGADIRRGIDGPALQQAMVQWARGNAALIRSIPEQALSQVEEIAQRALLTGADPRQTAAEIAERFGVADSRARLIARDQVANLNGQITRERNTALGIITYIWSSSIDERVRPEHQAMDGRLCRWDDPTVYSDDDGVTWLPRSQIGGVNEHPGMDIQCRCVSRPVLPAEYRALEAG